MCIYFPRHPGASVVNLLISLTFIKYISENKYFVFHFPTCLENVSRRWLAEVEKDPKVVPVGAAGLPTHIQSRVYRM